MGFLIDISDDAIANPCTSNIVKLSACQKDFAPRQKRRTKQILGPRRDATKFREKLERAMRFELTTFTLAR